jgi:hypothetical protein
MPKIDIDYSSTIIYKITCKDIAITDVYVGHTTNFVQRKHAHKLSCIKPKSANYKLKLYEVIRANGGWDNWKMEIINFFDCKDQSEARQKEQEYFISLSATLNSNEPFPKPKVKLSNVDKKHTELTAKKFNCELCNFTSDNKKNYTLHLRTKKHLECKKSDKQQSTYNCTQCQKQYYSRNGLWKHAKKCVVIPIDNTVVIPETQNTSSNEITVLTNLVLEVVKSNNELKQQLIDLLYKNNNSTV